MDQPVVEGIRLALVVEGEVLELFGLDLGLGVDALAVVDDPDIGPGQEIGREGRRDLGGGFGFQELVEVVCLFSPELHLRAWAVCPRRRLRVDPPRRPTADLRLDRRAHQLAVTCASCARPARRITQRECPQASAAAPAMDRTLQPVGCAITRSSELPTYLKAVRAFSGVMSSPLYE
ncbi:hypothetical protein [Streptomyces fagopyri]|uniref:hypothetical protein n=1 Tax=Streptomyces fagopyri TaxID=2662397 RepID=UPI0033D6C1C4